MRSNSCLQISHLAGSAMDKLPGTAKASSPKAPCQRERRLKEQTHSSLSRSESFLIQSTDLAQTSHLHLLSQQVSSELSEQTPKPCSVSSRSNMRSSKTIRSFGWRSSSAKRLTWTASSFYRMVPRSALPPHSVVRRRTSSLATQSNDGLWAISAMTGRPAVVPNLPMCGWCARTRSLPH